MRKLGLMTAFALMPSVAFAHVDVGQTTGFAHGFGHPISGLDHILAMVMVGMFAWQLGGRAVWAVPSAFVSVMALGGLLGVTGFHLPFVESVIAFSVIVLGAVVAFGARASLATAVGLVGLFAVFHGHAHGAEMPGSADGLAYAAGFMAATALLHGAGIACAYLLGAAGNRYGQAVTRMAGGFATVAGIGMLAGWL